MIVQTAGRHYIAAGFVVLFFVALAFRFGFVSVGVGLLLITCFSLFILALTDRMVIDRRRVVRTGLLPYVATLFTGRSLRLKFVNIEQIETFVFQRFKRGASVYYLYQTFIRSRNSEFVFSSNNKLYGKIIAEIFSNVPDDVMDNRSLELRDYFAERSAVNSRVLESEIPRGDALENSWRAVRPGRTRIANPQINVNGTNNYRAEHLRRLANELRIAGFLVQSLEAFRRAVLLQPRNGWLLFEFGRCILSCAASERDRALERQGFAMMRLAEQRAGRDVVLLSRLGESYFQAGEWRRASIAFRKATENIGATYRSVRGQAEIALREGKFAHVVHNFSVAHTLASARSLKRWTAAEIDYFTRLSGDHEYMELEISRLNLVDTLQNLGKRALPVAAASVAVILTGAAIGDIALADVGWTIASIAIIVWLAARAGCGVLATRIQQDSYDE